MSGDVSIYCFQYIWPVTKLWWWIPSLVWYFLDAAACWSIIDQLFLSWTMFLLHNISQSAWQTSNCRHYCFCAGGYESGKSVIFQTETRTQKQISYVVFFWFHFFWVNTWSFVLFQFLNKHSEAWTERVCTAPSPRPSRESFIHCRLLEHLEIHDHCCFGPFIANCLVFFVDYSFSTVPDHVGFVAFAWIFNVWR